MILHNIFPTNQDAPISPQIAPCMRRETTRLIDHDRQYVPVLVAYPDNQFLQSVGFNLGEIEMDTEDRLQLLVDFIRWMSLANPSGGYIPCSHKIVEQVAYLSYWKNLTLELRLEVVGQNLVVLARLARQPELNCVLDVFPANKVSSTDHEIQKWFDFLYQIVREHARIWQIHLIMAGCIFARLTPIPDERDVLVEVVDTDE